MTTPLIMLALLTGPWLVTQIAHRLLGRAWMSETYAGLLGITLLFTFTGVGHFLKPIPLAKMLPLWIPYLFEIVYASGVVELLAAAAILKPAWRRFVGLFFIVMLLLFLPLNINAAWNSRGPGGHQWGPIYLLIRVPLQGVLIAWIWWFAVRTENSESLSD